MNDLTKLREQIDQIDYQLIDLIVERKGIVDKVGEYKKNNNLAYRDEDRMNQLFESRKEYAKERGLDSEVVESMFQLLHDYFLELEEKNE